MTSGVKRHYRGGKSQGSRVGAEQKKRVLARLRAGETPTEIAQAEGLTRSAVMKLSRSL